MNDSQPAEKAVIEGYQSGALLDRILDALRKSGADVDALTPDALKPVDEFHTGGIAATEHLLSRLEILPGQQVLDIGSGLGGTARLIASRMGAEVTGIDLTPEFVEVANALSKRVGLADRTRFLVGSATDLPLPDRGFDHAVMIHVGMNVADKARIFAEAARVLRPGGRFALFEIVRGDNPEPLAFPLPWARGPEASFLARPEEYVEAAEKAGFRLVEEEDRTEFALAFFDRIFAMVAEKGLPPLGVHLVMGEDARDKMTNYVANTRAGRMGAREMVFAL